MEDDRKLCPFCQEENRKSSVFHHFTSKSSRPEQPETFHDDLGVQHSHDPDRKTFGYFCSNFHNWQEIGVPPCPAKGCNYGGYEIELSDGQDDQKKETVLDNDDP